MARPKKEIPAEDVLKLAAMGCTNVEIGAFFNVDEATIRKRFSEEIAKGKENGKTKLRKLMWQSAEKGNVAILIFLSKQLLGFTDKVETKQDITARVESNLTDEQLKAMAKSVLDE